MTPLPTPQLVSVASGIIIPPIVAWIAKSRWPAWTRSIISIALAMCTALITMAVHQTLKIPITARDWATLALTTIVATEASYRLWWKPSGVVSKLDPWPSVQEEHETKAEMTIPGQFTAKYHRHD